jgi:multimeric flavodoxin WrbA
MKVLGINCSPRKGGNTEILIKEVFKALAKEGIKTVFFQLG